MAYQTILYDVADNVLTITMNRPDKLNAYTTEMRREMVEAFDRADEDDDVRAIIVTGAGRAFCAGADLSRGDDTFDPGEDAEKVRDGGGRMSLRIYDCKKPVIAAVNGPAVGIGATMQLPMDIRLASANARFGFVFARRGVVNEACSSWFLPRIVGTGQALEWVMTGRVFDAEEALRGGLVRSIHQPDELLPAARKLAREIADNTSAVSVALCRQLIWKSWGEDHPMAAHRMESKALQGYMGQREDAHEGVRSFLEKRPAKFTMKPSKDMPDWYPWWQTPTF